MVLEEAARGAPIPVKLRPAGTPRAPAARDAAALHVSIVKTGERRELVATLARAVQLDDAEGVLRRSIPLAGGGLNPTAVAGLLDDALPWRQSPRPTIRRLLTAFKVPPQ